MRYIVIILEWIKNHLIEETNTRDLKRKKILKELNKTTRIGMVSGIMLTYIPVLDSWRYISNFGLLYDDKTHWFGQMWQRMSVDEKKEYNEKSEVFWSLGQLSFNSKETKIGRS